MIRRAWREFWDAYNAAIRRESQEARWNEAERKRDEALKRYGLTHADMGHVTSGAPCWCAPERMCVICHETAPCLHGTGRAEVVVHRRPA